VRFKAVIRAADTRNKLLSFVNLCELHVLAAIRRVHRVSLPKVRDSVEYLRNQLGADRPLVDQQFKTNGIDLFVEQASKLLNVSRQGQEDCAANSNSHSRALSATTRAIRSSYSLTAALQTTRRNSRNPWSLIRACPSDVPF